MFVGVGEFGGISNENDPPVAEPPLTTFPSIVNESKDTVMFGLLVTVIRSPFVQLIFLTIKDSPVPELHPIASPHPVIPLPQYDSKQPCGQPGLAVLKAHSPGRFGLDSPPPELHDPEFSQVIHDSSSSVASGL